MNFFNSITKMFNKDEEDQFSRYGEDYGKSIGGDNVDMINNRRGYEGMDNKMVDISTCGDSEAAIELKVVKPESYSNVTEIADHLLNHRTVVLNLESTNREIAKRLIDFLAGVAYSINGQLRNVANNTYIITPCNVDVADSPMKLAEPKNVTPEEQNAPTVNLTSDTLF